MRGCFADISSIVTQHGATEYAVNRMQSCAAALTASDELWSSRYWPFVVCIEEAFEVSALRKCAHSAGIAASSLEACYAAGSSQGDALVVDAAKKTFDHPGTPYLAVNGKSVESSELVAAVCSAYTGKKPAGCSDTVEEASEEVAQPCV